MVNKGLNSLIDILSERKNGEPEIANVSYDGDNFIIHFPNATAAHVVIAKLLNNFEEARLIDNSQLAKAKNYGAASGDKCDLNFDYNGNSLTMIFKPKIEKNALYDHLDNAIQKAKIGKNNDFSPNSTYVISIKHILEILNKIKIPPYTIGNSQSGDNYYTGFKGVGISNDNEFIIKYESGYNGFNRAKHFLSCLKQVGIISNDEISRLTMDLTKSNYSNPVSNEKANLAAEVRNDLIQINIKPANMREFKSSISDALNRTHSDTYLWENDTPSYIARKTSPTITEQEKIATQNYDSKVEGDRISKIAENAIKAKVSEEPTKIHKIPDHVKPYPEKLKPIREYLKEKTEAAFPRGAVRIAYYPNNDPSLDHSFEVTIKRSEAGSNDEHFHGFTKDLGERINRGGTITDLTNNDPERIGFRLNFNKQLLSQDLVKSDGKNFAIITGNANLSR